jgi:dTDP-4-dehydrorhamnose reductase
MRVAIIGSTGQLGTDLVKAFQKGNEVIGLTHRDLEVVDYNSCLLLKGYRPDIVINTAAFHKTDQCEDEPLRAFSVNSIGARNVAVTSKEIGATTVFISTDYVFSGSKGSPYTEEDVPMPINTYGISKLAGELFTKQNPKHYIIRVASLFGVAGASGKGGNFVETMISKAKKNDPISVIDDMWMSPTYTKDAASVIKTVIEQNIPFGIYHVTNSGFCSWYQFAEQIFNLLGLIVNVTPIKSYQLPTKAKRPEFSALQNLNLKKFGIEMPEWKDALRNYLIEKGHLR